MRKILTLILVLGVLGAIGQAKENLVRMNTKTSTFLEKYYPKQLVRIADTACIFELTHATLVGQSMQTVFDSSWYRMICDEGALVWADTLNQLATDYDLTLIAGTTTITITGDVTGSGVETIDATVVDDSHNHVIDNVDDLQDSLSVKMSNIVGSSATTLDSAMVFNWTSRKTEMRKVTVGAEVDPVWISDSTDYLHRNDTTTKVASRYWVNNQGFLTSYSETDPVYAGDSANTIWWKDTTSTGTNKIATKYELSQKVAIADSNTIGEGHYVAPKIWQDSLEIKMSKLVASVATTPDSVGYFNRTARRMEMRKMPAYLLSELDPIYAGDSAKILWWMDTIPVTGIATRYDLDTLTFLRTETDPLSFHITDSNTVKNAITLTYLNTQLAAKINKADSNLTSTGNYVTRKYGDEHYIQSLVGCLQWSDTTGKLATDYDVSLKVAIADSNTIGQGHYVAAKAFRDSLDAIEAPKYIIQQPATILPNSQAMGSLATGLVKNTTTTGVQSIATAGVDYLVTEVDGSTTNELQALSYLNGRMTISSGGGTPNTITVPLFSQVDTARGMVKGNAALGSTYFLNATNNWAVPPDNNTTYSAGLRMALVGTTFNNTSYWKDQDTVKTTLTGILKATSGLLSIASAGTDYQAPITPANVTAGSTKISLGGTPTGAALQAFSIDVAEANVNHNNLLNYSSAKHFYQKNIDTVKTTLTGILTATSGLLNTAIVTPTAGKADSALTYNWATGGLIAKRIQDSIWYAAFEGTYGFCIRPTNTLILHGVSKTLQGVYIPVRTRFDITGDYSDGRTIGAIINVQGIGTTDTLFYISNNKTINRRDSSFMIDKQARVFARGLTKAATADSMIGILTSTRELVIIPAAGGGTVTSISQGTGMLNSVNPITTTGTVGVDTTFVVVFNDTLGTGSTGKIATKKLVYDTAAVKMSKLVGVSASAADSVMYFNRTSQKAEMRLAPSGGAGDTTTRAWIKGSASVFLRDSTDRVSIGTSQGVSSRLEIFGNKTTDYLIHAYNDKDATTDSSFTVTKIGNTGIHEKSPAKDLQISNVAEPTIRLKENVNANWFDLRVGAAEDPAEFTIEDSDTKSRLYLYNGGAEIGYSSHTAALASPASLTLYPGAAGSFSILNDKTGSDSSMTFTAGGRLGLGTTTPINKLSVRGGANIYTDQDSIKLWTDKAGAALNGDSGMTILPSGNVGIGTITPINPLSVEGGANIYTNQDSIKLWTDKRGTAAFNGDSGMTILPNGQIYEGINKVMNHQEIQNTISEGKAYNFDGTNDYVSLGTSTQLDLGTGDGTYFVRFKNDGNDGAENVLFDVADGTSGDRQVVELTTTGKVYGFFLNNSATYIDIQGNTDIGADNKIHSVAMSIDRSSATGLNVYLDGKTDATPVDATTIQGLSIVSSGTKYIGIHNAGSLYPFAGSIYDFKYFNMALSAAEIKDLSEGGSVPYKYTGASNTTLVTNGTLTSGTSWSRTGGVTLSGDKAVFDNATVGLCYQNATVTKGKQYRVTFTVSDLTEGGNQARIAMLDNTQSVYVLSPGNYVNGTHVVDFTALNNSTTFSLYCLTSSNSSFKVDDLSFIRIGEILSLDQPGMSTATWFDQSGNGINGTVSGASLYDSPLYTNVQNFNASGNVGIGTTSPAESFSVNGTTNLGNGAWPTTSLGKSNQRVSMISHTENDQNVNIGTMPLDGSVGINRGGYLTLFSRATTSGLDAAGGRILGAKASANSGTRSGYLKFYTSVFGGSFTLAMTIDSAQKIIALPTYSVTVGGTNRDLYIDDTGLIGYVSSDSSVKTKIKSMENINWLYKLRPVNYIYKSDSVKWKQYGLIAEEVDTINKWIVSYDYIFDSVTGDTLQKKVATVNYSRLIVPLVKSAQDQKEQLDALNPLITLITLTTGATTTGTITISNDSGIPKAGIAATMYFNSPSPVNFTPGVKQIANGQYDGQEIEIVGFDNTNTLTLDQNDNLKLKGGATWVGGKFDIIKLKWVNGLNNWIEVTRSDN